MGAGNFTFDMKMLIVFFEKEVCNISSKLLPILKKI